MNATTLFEGGGSGAARHALVTGGTGFVGRHLVAALRMQGHRVTVLTRRPVATAQPALPGVHAVNTLAELDAAPPVHWVFNLAGARILGWPWTAARKRTLLASRVGTTESLVAWIATQPAERRPERLVSASAIGYYGVQAEGDERELAEGAPPQPIFMSQLCQQWEAAAAQAAPLGVAVACMRLGLVMGRGGGALPALLRPVRLGLGGPLGGGRQWLSWVHLDDVLAAFSHVALRPRLHGVSTYNLAAPEAVRQADFARIAARVLRRPQGLPAPGWPLRLALGEQATLLLDGQRVAPVRLQAESFAFAHPTLEGALRDLV